MDEGYTKGGMRLWSQARGVIAERAEMTGTGRGGDEARMWRGALWIERREKLEIGF